MDFLSSITAQLPFPPTGDQAKAIKELSFFLEDKDTRSAFVLRGYAGTGKTTLVAALVKSLRLSKVKTALLAPTGRAAKVMAVYAYKQASTIHRHIYEVLDGSGKPTFSRKENKSKNTLYIVDEASMISDEGRMARISLLRDLIEFAFQEEKNGNKLLFVGDTAQLPPVHCVDSPALSDQYLISNYQVKCASAVLKEVVRQGADSGILANATLVREAIEKENLNVKFSTLPYSDIYKMTSEKLEDGLRYAYQKYGAEDTAIVCRSNRQAVQFNQYIRKQIFFYENEIEAGDLIMVVKNNYFWLPENSPAGFLANGEFAEVMKVGITEEMYGKRFATLTLRLLDYPKMPSFEAKVILDTLYHNKANLGEDELKEMKEKITQEYIDAFPKPKERGVHLLNDQYLNALQIKFAYALTCHKSQGGQWGAVFADQGYLTDEMYNLEYLRWLYTALTRASKELYLVNFSKRFY